MNIADDLGYVDNIYNRMYGASNAGDASNLNIRPTVTQNAFQSMANSSIAPFQNASANFNKTYTDITNPKGGVLQSGLTDAADLYNLKHNPFGGQAKQYQMPQLDDKHLGPADENGLRKVLDSGHAILQDHANNFGIADNTALLSSNPSAALGVPLNPNSPSSAQQPSALGNAAKGVASDAVASYASDSGLLGELAAFL